MNRICELRIASNKSMAQIARELNMPYTTYVNYEKGYRELNSEILIQFANYFNVTIDYLIGRSNSKQPININKINVINKPSTIVRNRRTELGLTIEELAKAVGVNESKVKNLENGYRIHLKPNELTKLAKVLEIDPILLLENEPNFSPKVADSSNRFKIHTDEEKLLLNNYNTLNQIGKEKLIDYSDDLVSNGKYTEKETK